MPSFFSSASPREKKGKRKLTRRHKDAERNDKIQMANDNTEFVLNISYLSLVIVFPFVLCHYFFSAPLSLRGESENPGHAYLKRRFLTFGQSQILLLALGSNASYAVF